MVKATSWSLCRFCSAARTCAAAAERSPDNGSVDEKKTSTGWPRSRSGLTTRRANEQRVRLNARGEPARSTATGAREGSESQCPAMSEWNRKRLVALATPAAAKNATIAATATRTTAFLRFNAVAATCAKLPTARERVWCESLCSLSPARCVPAISVSPDALSTERRRAAAMPAGIVAAIESELVETGRHPRLDQSHAAAASARLYRRTAVARHAAGRPVKSARGRLRRRVGTASASLVAILAQVSNTPD